MYDRETWRLSAVLKLKFWIPHTATTQTKQLRRRIASHLGTPSLPRSNWIPPRCPRGGSRPRRSKALTLDATRVLHFPRYCRYLCEGHLCRHRPGGCFSQRSARAFFLFRRSCRCSQTSSRTFVTDMITDIYHKADEGGWGRANLAHLLP